MAEPPGELGKAGDELGIVARRPAVGQQQIILESDPYMPAEGGRTQAAFDLSRAEGAGGPGNVDGYLSQGAPSGEHGEEVGEAGALPGGVASQHEQHPMPPFGNESAPPEL